MAKRIGEEAGDEAEARVRQYYKIVFQREATTKEVEAGVDFISGAEASPSTIAANTAAGDKAEVPLNPWELYAQTLLLSNELIFLD